MNTRQATNNIRFMDVGNVTTIDLSALTRMDRPVINRRFYVRDRRRNVEICKHCRRVSMFWILVWEGDGAYQFEARFCPLCNTLHEGRKFQDRPEDVEYFKARIERWMQGVDQWEDIPKL